jgi:hypothetical protein
MLRGYKDKGNHSRQLSFETPDFKNKSFRAE